MFLNLQPTYMQHARDAAEMNAAMDNWVNLRAPGVREQLPDAVMPFQSMHQRGALYDPLVPGSAPVHNDAGRVGFETDTRGQCFQQEMRYILNSTPVAEHWSVRDFGTFTVAPTGFSRLRDITPYGTSKFI